jgi:peptidoglycan/LPS O-acetylase OafA/YrhL
MTLDRPRPAPPPLGHQPALDGLRGIACLLVVFSHQLPPLQLRGGAVGVDLFFVLSGFLITSGLTSDWRTKGDLDLPRFWSRRALRLLPALWAMVWILVLAGRVMNQPELYPPPIQIASVLGYVHNWFVALRPPTRMTMLTPCWSLCVEEQFYLTWPLVLRPLLRRFRLEQIVVLAFLGALTAAAWRTALAWHGIHWVRLYHATDTRADSLLIGCAVALLRDSNHLRLRPRLGLCTLLAGSAVLGWVATHLFIPASVLYRGGLMFIDAIASAGILYGALCPLPAGVGRLLTLAPLRGLGRISYGVYLWHCAGTWLVCQCFDVPPQYGVQFALTLALALASYYGIERPFLRWKRGFGARRPAPAPEPLAEPTLLTTRPVGSL